MRGWAQWTGAVPELGDYKNLLHPKSPRSVFLSKGNLPDYNRLVKALRKA